MVKKRIAVIGAGPKAVALVTKAQIVKSLGGVEVEVVTFDPNGIGAAWSGVNGYTDGSQQLCTLAERDLGYPYSDLLGLPYAGQDSNDPAAISVSRAMRAEFSWLSYLETRPQDLANWIDRGRLPPKHRDFVAYLQWAFAKAKGRHFPEKVLKLVPTARRTGWKVVTAKQEHKPFDGVVLTGPGPARQIPGPPSRRIFNGQDFWQRLDEVKRFLGRLQNPKSVHDGDRIVVIGAGGTAALNRTGFRGGNLV